MLERTREALEANLTRFVWPWLAQMYIDLLEEYDALVAENTSQESAIEALNAVVDDQRIALAELQAIVDELPGFVELTEDDLSKLRAGE
jgi:uncharacterized coiled-coil protein SlyX